MDGSRNVNPPGIGIVALLIEDLRTHGSLCSQGFWAIAANRIGNWRMDLHPWILRAPVTLLYRALYNCVHWICHIELPYIVPVGRRVHIMHFGGNVLGARSIGDEVQIRHNTTFGMASHTDTIEDLPTIEERVMVGGGAYVLGRITVGHDSVIGANSVVTQDVPPYSVVAGIPARVIRKLPEEPLRFPPPARRS
jgi:serine O-acetyltransferase